MEGCGGGGGGGGGDYQSRKLLVACASKRRSTSNDIKIKKTIVNILAATIEKLFVCLSFVVCFSSTTNKILEQQQPQTQLLCQFMKKYL